MQILIRRLLKPRKLRLATDDFVLLPIGIQLKAVNLEFEGEKFTLFDRINKILSKNTSLWRFRMLVVGELQSAALRLKHTLFFKQLAWFTIDLNPFKNAFC